MLMKEAIERYKNWGGLGYKRGTSQGTIKGYEKDLLLLCLYLRNPHIEKIVEPQITAYFREMLDLGWSPNGLMCKSIAVRNLLQYAKRIGLDVIDHELVQIIPRDIKQPHAAEEWEIDKLLDQCKLDPKLMSIRNKAIICFLKSVGCRNTEMCALNVSQLMEYFDEKRLVTKTAKSKGVKPIRELFWDDDAHAALKEWLVAREELAAKIPFPEPDALFVAVRGKDVGKRMTNSSVGIMFRQLGRRAGLKQTVNAHSFRHYRAHELNESGANNSHISNILGHSSLASSYVYTQMKSESLKIAAQKYRKGNGPEIDSNSLSTIIQELLEIQRRGLAK